MYTSTRVTYVCTWSIVFKWKYFYWVTKNYIIYDLLLRSLIICTINIFTFSFLTNVLARSTKKIRAYFLLDIEVDSWAQNLIFARSTTRDKGGSNGGGEGKGGWQKQRNLWGLGSWMGRGKRKEGKMEGVLGSWEKILRGGIYCETYNKWFKIPKWNLTLKKWENSWILCGTMGLQKSCSRSQNEIYQ